MKRIAIAVVLLISCTPPPNTPTNPPDCETACAVLASHGCVEARPTPKGVTCVDVCREAPAYAGLPVECVASATTVEQLRGVCHVCRP